MNDRDIENRIRSAFDNIVPDVLDSVLEQCSEQKGRAISMTENKKRIPIVKIAVVAAAVVLLLTASITAAATFTGLVGEDRAFGTAINYVVQHAENTEEKLTLSNYILAGLTYDQTSETQEVRFGLSGLRPVYNVKFKVGGYAYTVKVDAKTETILSCDRETDENWEEHLSETTQGAGYQGWPEGFDTTSLTISTNEAEDIVSDYFGFTWSGYYANRSTCNYDFDDDPISYVWTFEFGGKRYSCHVDSETGEVSEASVEPIGDYDGETYEPVPAPDGYLNLMEVRELALEYLSEERADVSKWNIFIHPKFADENYPVDYYSVLICQWEGQFYENTGDIKVAAATGEILKGLSNMSWADIKHIVADAADITYDNIDTYSMLETDGQYKVYIASSKDGRYAKAVVDAETGELIEIEINGIPQKDGKPAEEVLRNQTLDLNAPDGMISEAVAAAIAFENSGVNEQCIWALKVSLDDGVYHISYWFGYEDFNETTDFGDYRTNTYEIDAVTGKILNCDAFTPKDYISEETAFALAYGLADIDESDVDRATIEFQNSPMGYPRYEIKLYSHEGTIYYYQLDAINGYDHIVKLPD